MAISAEYQNIPPRVKARLSTLRRHTISGLVLRGLFMIAATALAVLLLALALDWFIVWKWTAARTTVFLLWLACIGYVGFRYALVLPFQGMRLRQIARRVEQFVPGLQERWSTVTEIAQANDPPELLGSATLIHQVRQESEALENLVDPLRLRFVTGLRRWISIVILLLVIFAGLLLLAPAPAGLLLNRFFHPFQAMPLTSIQSLTGDAVVPLGEPLVLQATAAGRVPERAILHWNSLEAAGDAVHKETLRRLTEPRDGFQYQMRAVNHSFTYRFEAGDGKTKWHTITAAPRPELSGVRLRLIPPAYSTLPSEELDHLPRRHRALAGSRLELVLNSNKPLAKFELKLDDKRALELEALDAQSWRWNTLLEESLTFTPRLLDEQGLENKAGQACRLIVYPDRPPTIDIESPDKELTLPPDGKLKIEFKAEDDFGLDAAKLMMTVQRQDARVGERTARVEKPIELGDKRGAKALRVDIEVDLAPLQLKHGDSVSFSVQVSDNRALTAADEIAMGQQTDGQQTAAAADQTPPSEGAAQSQNAQQTATADAARDKSAKSADQARNAQSQQARSGDQPTSRSDASGKSQPFPFEREMQPKKPGEGTVSAPPTKIEMAMRAGFAPASCQSSPINIRIDQWSGSFDSQQEEKLQIDIDMFLAQFKALLVEAAGASGPLTRDLERGLPWNSDQSGRVALARDRLAAASRLVTQLRQKSDGTPYAFAGYQLADLVQTHLLPADSLLQSTMKTEDMAARATSAGEADWHISRALEQLEDLLKRYEAAKREQKRKALLEQFAKMHQIFVEDLQKMISAQSPPTLNPRDPLGTMEVSDEFVRQLEERYRKLRDLLDELSRLMAKDPDLMHRYMSLAHLRSRTLRDQMTLLAQRQQALTQDLGNWVTAPESQRPKLKQELRERQVVEKAELAGIADDLRDEYRTWKPKQPGPAEQALAAGGDKTHAVALAEHEIVRSLPPADPAPGVEPTRDVIAKLQELDAHLAEASELGANQPHVPEFTAKRMGEGRTLAAREAGWQEKTEAAGAGNVGRVQAVDLYRLMIDTIAFGDKMDSIAPMLRQASSSAGTATEELVRSLRDTIPPLQTEAGRALQGGHLFLARETEQRALKAYQDAEAQFDRILNAVEAEIAQMPPPSGVPELPSLEELLKLLENELEACEKLGAAGRLMNIAIYSDWFLPGEEMGSGGGSGTGSGTGGGTAGGGMSANSYARALARQSQMLARQNDETFRRLLQNLRDQTGDTPPTDTVQQPTPVPGTDDRDWATLASELEDELAQGRRPQPPEAYRRAIDDYFRTLVEFGGTEGGP